MGDNMRNKKSEEEYKNDLNEIWKQYISPAYDNPSTCAYYVKDIANCEKDEVEYIILCESPHKEEVEYKDKAGRPNPVPLVGTSGKAVSNFLFGESAPIGELIDEKNKKCFHKIAIVNVCNVPLQKIDQNKDKVENLELDYLRDSCKVIIELSENLKERIKKYQKARIIVVCGEFAMAYYNEIKNNFQTLKALNVPHPSRNHWQFIYENKDDISTLKWIFKTN